jgi:hypothetical protein
MVVRAVDVVLDELEKVVGFGLFEFCEAGYEAGVDV